MSGLTPTLACVRIAALPLQIALAEHPEWRSLPVVVTARLGLQAPVLWLNQVAYRQGIRRQMRLGAAQSLVENLEVAHYEPSKAQKFREHIAAALLHFTPSVEPVTPCASGSPKFERLGEDIGEGVFWLDPKGLGHLYPDLLRWLQMLRACLAKMGIQSAAVAGFNRCYVYALVCGGTQELVTQTIETERKLAGQTGLAQMGLSYKLTSTAAHLGMTQLAHLLALTPEVLRERLGLEAYQLAQAARTGLQVALHPLISIPPFEKSVDLSYATTETPRLMATIEPLISEALEEICKRYQSLLSLSLCLKSRHETEYDFSLTPACPTRQSSVLFELIRLRLDKVRITAPILSVHLRCVATAYREHQLLLTHNLNSRSRRNLIRAAEGLAQVRAMFGDESVTRAELFAAYLPEASFRYVPARDITLPEKQKLPARLPCVRSFLPTPVQQEPPGPLALMRSGGNLRPLRISGRWWRRPFRRDYYYSQISENRVVFLYFDWMQRQWFTQAYLD